jgi:hypothetical protein
LLKSPCLSNPDTEYPEDGDHIIPRPRWEDADVKGTGRVWINDAQYFDKVPLVAWEFYIGGYQPAQKWLKDRKGHKLTYDDITHYQRVIMALAKTDEIQQAIDG